MEKFINKYILPEGMEIPKEEGVRKMWILAIVGLFLVLLISTLQPLAN